MLRLIDRLTERIVLFARAEGADGAVSYVEQGAVFAELRAARSGVNFGTEPYGPLRFLCRIRRIDERLLGWRARWRDRLFQVVDVLGENLADDSLEVLIEEVGG